MSGVMWCEVPNTTLALYRFQQPLVQVGSWCCGEYGEQLFVEIEEDEATPVSINFSHDANCSQISVVTVTFPKIEKVFQIVVLWWICFLCMFLSSSFLLCYLRCCFLLFVCIVVFSLFTVRPCILTTVCRERIQHYWCPLETAIITVASATKIRLISGVISTADVKQWKQNIRNNDP